MGSVSRCWLEDTLGCSHEAGKSEDAGDAWAAETVSVLVLTADAGTWRRFRVSIRSPLQRLGELCAEAFEIGRPEDFAFFQVGAGGEHLCPLAADASVSNFFYSWRRSQHCGENALLYRRDAMTAGESLQLQDAAHARLTYRQALGDYLRYPAVEEELPLIFRIAAAVLLVEMQNRRCAEEEGDSLLQLLCRDGALERIFPEAFLQTLGRCEAATGVASALAEAARESRGELEAMGGAFALMRQLAFFGSCRWLVRQAVEVPQDDWQVLPPNPNVCVLDASAPSRDYWLCVDPFGVRLVAPPCGRGRTFQQGFLFEGPPGLPRLQSCRFVKSGLGSSDHGTVQLVVSGLGAEEEACTTLAFESSSALDIRHAIGRMQSACGAGTAAATPTAAWFASVLPRALTLLPAVATGPAREIRWEIRCFALCGDVVAAVPADAHARVETLRAELAQRLQTPAIRLKLATQDARLLHDGDLVASI